jgi:putative phosphoribosyl transferase
MYFNSRVEAGQVLAKQIAQKYSGSDSAVVALNDGGVMVGSQIALKLHAVLVLLLSEAITLPREDAAVAGISQDGAVSYNHRYSQGEIDEFLAEYYHYIEQEKLNKMQEMNRLIGKGGLIRKDLLSKRNVILVTDGLQDGFLLETIDTKRIVVATPLASVQAVDHMHILADEIFCLSTIADYISTEHYYDVQDVPPHEKIISTIEHIVANWK